MVHSLPNGALARMGAHTAGPAGTPAGPTVSGLLDDGVQGDVVRLSSDAGVVAHLGNAMHAVQVDALDRAGVDARLEGRAHRGAVEMGVRGGQVHYHVAQRNLGLGAGVE